MRNWDREAVKALHSAVYRRDGSIVELLSGRLTDDVLQLTGDGLLDALTQGVAGAPELAAQCASALRKRDWVGDEELADQLEAAIDQGATPLLRELPVDLAQLGSIREGDPVWGGGRIDLKTGDCWPGGSEFDEDEDDESDDAEDRWLYVEPAGSRDGYRDMELFITTVEDPEIADRLEIAISGRGAFRRFKDVLSRWPSELDRYFQLCSERQCGRARAWLAGEGYRPTPAAQASP
jgi:Uncharacterised protein family (UPF0158)